MKILVIGCNGQVGWELVRCLQPLGEVIGLDRRQLDLSNLANIGAVLYKVLPDVIVNAAAYTAVDKAEDDERMANLINGNAPELLAEGAKRIGALLIHYSTDYVFDGTKATPYTEEDLPNPINVYGRSKLMGEQAIQAAGAECIILRTSWVYSTRGNNFLRTILRLAQEREELSIVADQIGSPTWARLIAESTAHVVKQSQAERSRGLFQSDLYHLTSAGETSWFGFAQAIVEQARQMPDYSLTLKQINAIPTSDYPTSARRPMNSRLVTAKFEKFFRLKMPLWMEWFCLGLGEVSDIKSKRDSVWRMCSE